MVAKIGIEKNNVRINGTIVTVGGLGSCTHRTLQSDSSSGGNITFDWSADNFLVVTLTENITGVTFTAPPGPVDPLTLKVIQGAGAFTVGGWPAAVKWAGGAAPVISVAAGAIDVIRYFFDGTNYYGTFDQAFS